MLPLSRSVLKLCFPNRGSKYLRYKSVHGRVARSNIESLLHFVRVRQQMIARGPNVIANLLRERGVPIPIVLVKGVLDGRQWSIGKPYLVVLFRSVSARTGARCTLLHRMTSGFVLGSSPVDHALQYFPICFTLYRGTLHASSKDFWIWFGFVTNRPSSTTCTSPPCFFEKNEYTTQWS